MCVRELLLYKNCVQFHGDSGERAFSMFLNHFIWTPNRIVLNHIPGIVVWNSLAYPTFKTFNDMYSNIMLIRNCNVIYVHRCFPHLFCTCNLYTSKSMTIPSTMAGITNAKHLMKNETKWVLCSSFPNVNPFLIYSNILYSKYLKWFKEINWTN